MAEFGPLLPANQSIQDIADKVRSTLEKKVGMKFEIYRALTYRQSPYFPKLPIPGGGGPGPVLIEADYIIKVVTFPEEHLKCYHIIVEANFQTNTYTLLAYFPDLDLHAPLHKVCVRGSSGNVK